MKREYFKPDVWEKINKYLTPEKANAAGFKVYGMKITPQLADKIQDYIRKEKINTYCQFTKDGRSINFLYTPHFSVKIYIRDDGKYSSCFIDNGARGNVIGENDRKTYEYKFKKSMTKMEIYFAIINKYPEHLLDISCATNSCATKTIELDYDQDLFDTLWALRKRLADDAVVPPYVIFSDITLAEMASYHPTTPEALLRINGVGRLKLQHYGAPFIEEIKSYLGRS